jgi:hypothetical protein
MKLKKIKEMVLENNQTIVISDGSRMISKDAYLVTMKATMDIAVEKDLFSDKEQKEIFFEDILDKVGPVAVYEFIAERNFVMADNKEELFEKLQNDFFENLGKYISKPDFPKKLVLKQYKDSINNKTKTIKV